MISRLSLPPLLRLVPNPENPENVFLWLDRCCISLLKMVQNHSEDIFSLRLLGLDGTSLVFFLFKSITRRPSAAVGEEVV